MKTSLIKIIKIGLPILLAIFFGWFTFSKLPITDIIPYFESANYWWIMAGIGFGLLSHISRAYRWRYMLKPLGYNIKLPNSFMGLFIAYLANYGIPRSGEILRATVVSNYEKVPFQKGFGTIIAERIIDLLIMLTIVVITLFFQYDFIYNLLIEQFNPIKLFIMVVFISIIGIILLLFIRKSKFKIAVRFRSFISGLIEGVTSILKLKQKWSFILHTIFIWIMYIVMFYVTSFAITDLHDVSFEAIMIAFIAASFTIAATNGGLFFYPAAVLAAFVLFDLPEKASYAFGWIVWTSQTIMIVVIGVISFILLPVYNGRKNSKNNYAKI